MNLSFYIQPEDINTIDADLYFGICEQGLSYIILNGDTCHALAICNFESGTSDETAADYIHQLIAEHPVLKQQFKKVHIIYGYTQSVLVPHKFMNEPGNNCMLELVYGLGSERITRTDFMYRHSIHNIYCIPTVIEQMISRYFIFPDYIHLFSLLPDVVNEPANDLYCIFSMGRVKVLLIKEAKLQVMQNYTYKTPEDAVYYLLNLCDSFEIKVNDSIVHLSGMIDVNSALYRELYKYFLQLHFEKLPARYQYPEEIHQYPAHYFGHLFAIAACV